MSLRAAGLLLLGGISTPVLADNIEFDLRDDALRGAYTMDLNGRGLNADFGILYNEDPEQLDDTLVHAGLMVNGENWSKSGTFDISLGGRMIYSSPGELDLSALAIGGSLRFSPVHRLGIGGSAFYAPDIISFMDAENYGEITLRLDYQVLPQAFVFVGYRNVEVDIVDGPRNVELDEGAHVGMKLLF